MEPYYLSIISKYLNSSFDMLNLKKLSKNTFDYINDKHIFYNDGIFIYDLNKINFNTYFLETFETNIIKHNKIYIFNQFDIKLFYDLLSHISENTTIYIYHKIIFNYNNDNDYIKEIIELINDKKIRLNYNMIFYHYINIIYLFIDENGKNKLDINNFIDKNKILDEINICY